MRRPLLSILTVAVSTAACGPSQQNLDELNAEIEVTPLQAAMARKEHFRPLCDDQGYPLVGNMNAKEVTSAAKFCSELHQQERQK